MLHTAFPDQEALGSFLKEVQKGYHQKRFLNSDPLEFAHRFEDPWDQEAVALLAAVLAYGKVAQIRKSLEEVLRRMDQISDGPADFVRKLQRPAFVKKASVCFEGFVHRFNVGSDIVSLLWLLSRSWLEFGSLGGHFIQFLEPEETHIGAALTAFISEWRQWLGLRETATFHYLLTSPEDGSCCKRWCMFLRWMGRLDELDLGLWTQGGKMVTSFPSGRYLKPSQLVMPLDTHTGRISQYLGLTQRKSLNWKAALEVTEELKKIDPNDPVQYDFALSRLGILP